MAEPEPQPLQARLRWVGGDDDPFLAVNQMLAQVSQGDVLLIFGHATPPMVIGSPEEQQEQLKDIEFVPVRSVARISMNPDRFREVVEALNRTLAVVEQGQEPRTEDK